jgi:uncharacterized membrane protein
MLSAAAVAGLRFLFVGCNCMSDWVLSPVFDNLLLLWGLAAGMFALWIWGALVTRTTRRRRLALAGIRLAVILLALLGLLRPTLITKDMKPQRSTLVLLVDQSRSMLVTDAFGGQTRWDLLTKTLSEAWPVLRELSDSYEIKLYSFDSDLHTVDFQPERLKLPGAPDGPQTAIGSSLRDAIQSEAGKQLAGVFLLTDGAQNSQAPRDLPPQTATRELLSQGTPLYTVVFGQARAAGQNRDIAVTEAIGDREIFVKNQFSMTGSVRVDGYVNQAIPVDLLWESAPGGGKMASVAAKKVTAAQDGALLPIEFTYLPQVPGEFKVTLRATEMPGELVKSNNELSTFVTVLKGGLNVLYLEGELRVEQRFLRRALDSSPNIHVDYRYFDQYNEKEARGIDLSREFAKGTYDVVILGDIDSLVFRPQDLEALRDRVREGTGLLTLGGFHAYWLGGFNKTPLVQVLPFLTAASDNTLRQFPDQPTLTTRSDQHIFQPVQMQPAAPFGIQSPIMQLDSPEKNAAVWAKLPPLDGANILPALKPSAHVLAESTQGKPLLVSQEVEAGRVLCFAGDSTWHWFMKGHPLEFKRFWRQAIFWLARKSPDEAVSIQLDQRRFSPGGRVDFAAAARGADGLPIIDAAFTAEVIRPDGVKRPIALGRAAEKATGSFVDTSLAGDYTLIVSATEKGRPLGQARARFLVYEQDLELTNSAARPDLLASLATMTQAVGGKALTPEQLSSVFKELQAKPRQALVEREEKHTPWDKWPFLALFIGLLSTEWFLRKKWGLV